MCSESHSRNVLQVIREPFVAGCVVPQEMQVLARRRGDSLYQIKGLFVTCRQIGADSESGKWSTVNYAN